MLIPDMAKSPKLVTPNAFSYKALKQLIMNADEAAAKDEERQMHKSDNKRLLN